MKSYANALLGAMLVSNTVSAQAQQQPERIEEVIVIAHPLSGEGLAQAHAVLAGAELERKLATNLGATLAGRSFMVWAGRVYASWKTASIPWTYRLPAPIMLSPSSHSSLNGSKCSKVPVHYCMDPAL